MLKGIRNEQLFCQKLYSGDVGRTYGGDIDNFYFGSNGDRLIIWEAKHKNAKHDYDSPQAYFLKKLVDHLKDLYVLLVWVEHESDSNIIHLKDCVPVKIYAKPTGFTRGKLIDPKFTTVQEIADWADRKI